jgi:hypothetical protein
VSVKTLLDAAQKSMRIPDPVVQRNPTMKGSGAPSRPSPPPPATFGDHHRQAEGVPAVLAGRQRLLHGRAVRDALDPGDERGGRLRITFTRASAAAGWPVTASTTVDVPVNEVQSVVTRTD